MSLYNYVSIPSPVSDLHKKIRIAVAHMRVHESNIEASFLDRPIRTRERLMEINNLLNDLVRSGSKHQRRIDLVVMPEVSVPHAWQPMLVAWARKHQIGVVCGLEHRVADGFAYNEILAILPYKTPLGISTCIPVRRLKRYYSPEEIYILKNNFLNVPEENRPTSNIPPYDLFEWRGASFAIYNCYELTSIEDRSLFKAKVDFIICSEFNKDINYFSNIVESAARDLHCYVVQVNDSKFGDSRVVSPSPIVKMNPLRIKGGDNCTFLTTELDLEALRSHQRKGYGLQKHSEVFKPTPPGFNREHVINRIRVSE